jgi:hypothetical protein
MKRILLLTLVTLSSLAVTFAQTSASAGAKAKTMVGDINATVHLTGGQWTTVNDACVTYFTKLDELDKQKGTLSATDYSNKVATLKGERNASIQAGLDASQTKGWNDYLAQHK